ncbi:MAG TPA: hypothetical protein VFQ96_02165, partial [Microbacteriaceae bacterium]|nr:hypothetical protein [Microbacteriaceae bacterium]
MTLQNIACYQEELDGRTMGCVPLSPTPRHTGHPVMPSTRHPAGPGRDPHANPNRLAARRGRFTALGARITRRSAWLAARAREVWPGVALCA